MCGFTAGDQTGPLETNLAVDLKKLITIDSDSLPTKSTNEVSISHSNLYLPPFSKVALKVMKLTESETSSLNEMSSLISSDVAFAAEVLIIANSYRYANRFRVKSIPHAVAVLGVKTVHAICLTVGVRSFLGKALGEPTMKALWRHNLATALCAERIATGGFVDASLAYSCGLLHDIGRLAMGVMHPKEYGSLLGTFQGKPEDILDEERGLFGVDHCQMGTQLATDWELPEEYWEPITHHHKPREAGESGTVMEIIKIGCGIADIAGFSAFSGCECAHYAEMLENIPERERGSLPATGEELRQDIAEKINLIDI